MREVNPEKLTSLIERRIADDMADGKVGGAGICVMQSGKKVYKNYFGYKNIKNHERLADSGDNTIFRLASMTKPVTTVAALIQVEKGLLDLDEPISELLPDFKEMNIGKLDKNGKVYVTGPSHTPITLKMLLNHTSGIGSAPVKDAEKAAMTENDKLTIRNVVDYVAKCPIAFEPATAQAYSSFWAFDVTARLIELTSGEPFEQFLKENIFDPCSMTDTTFAPTESQWERMITMHDRKVIDGKGVGVDADFPSHVVFEGFGYKWYSGGAALASTMPDYIKFAEMLRKGGLVSSVNSRGEVEEKRILQQSMVEKMSTPTVPAQIMPGYQRWGLGVRVIGNNHVCMPEGCYGWSGAYGSHFWVDPANDITAFYFKNSRYDGGSGAVTAANLEKDVYASLE